MTKQRDDGDDETDLGVEVNAAFLVRQQQEVPFYSATADIPNLQHARRDCIGGTCITNAVYNRVVVAVVAVILIVIILYVQAKAGIELVSATQLVETVKPLMLMQQQQPVNVTDHK